MKFWKTKVTKTTRRKNPFWDISAGPSHDVEIVPSIKRQIRDLEDSMKILFENPSIKKIFENLLIDTDKSLEQQIALAARKGLFLLFFNKIIQKY